MTSGWWLLLFVICLGAFGAVASFACSTAFRRATGFGRRFSLVMGWALWAVVATSMAWVFFEQDVAEANRTSTNNIGIPIAYSAGWVISVFVGPLFGYVTSAIWRAFHEE